MAKDKCILCGDPTIYDFDAPLNLRRHYIEGAGQLCEDCWFNMGSGKNYFFEVPKHYIYKFSNDQELGQRIRELYFTKLKQ